MSGSEARLSGAYPAIGNISDPFLPGVDHLPHTHNLKDQAFTRGQPETGASLADKLEDIVALHDPSTIAAVIVEPVAGAGGVLVPPRGYLERLREICDRYGILLIFDEVITGFGRLGANFGADYFGIVPDILTMAKGLTNGTVPMSAVAVRKGIYDAFMQGPPNIIELFHGYTYSGHPLACAAALATLDVFAEEGLVERARDLAGEWEGALHSLAGTRNVVDIRNLGLMGAVQLQPREGAPTARASETALRCFENGLLLRQTGETLAMSPPLIVSVSQIHEMVDMLRAAIRETD